jgi:hypothetical protein
MNSSRKLLILSGLALAIFGMAYGLHYAVFVEHQTLDQMGGSLNHAFASSAVRDLPQANHSLDEYAQRRFVYLRQVDAHSHWIGLAMLLLALGLVFDRVGFSARIRSLLAATLVLGCAIFPLGVLLETLDSGKIPQAIAVAGSALIIVSLAAIAAGFWRARQSPDPAP